MNLIQFTGYAAMVELEPGDCAALADFCYRAEDSLAMLEDAPILAQARTYGATFKALAVASMVAPGFLLRGAQEALAHELTALRLGDLVSMPWLARGEQKQAEADG